VELGYIRAGFTSEDLDDVRIEWLNLLVSVPS
jgi:hypothetical protein